MSSEPLLQCSEPTCQFGENPLGHRVCVQCETPLRYRYLWVVGSAATDYAVGTMVCDRYYVANVQTWLDLRPANPPATPAEFPAAALPYLKAHQHRLHVPGLYDVWHPAKEYPAKEPTQAAPLLLLDNEPFDGKGQLRPTLAQQWQQTNPTRQVYWLWQILELWLVLGDLQLEDSLLQPEHLRVDGWRVRLRQLVPSATSPIPKSSPFAKGTETAAARRLPLLAASWADWISQAQAAVMQPLQDICQHMQQGEASVEQIRRQLNYLLLQQTARYPLRLTVSGGSDVGQQRSHNEDSCYPDTEELKRLPPDDPTRVPQLAIVCDGIGGHEGGEVASQMAVRSLRPQMQALLNEIAEQPDIVPPDTIISQIEATVRVVNNLIDFQNNTHGRAERQRMGTTLTLALVVPQRIETAAGWSQAHELYLASVGDSRAYWITPNGCHLLTVDDVIASRHTLAARRLYADALQHPESQALTQALGTRDADFLSPHIQRFIVEEDGVLLLCSDGLSDQDRVEQSWARFIGLITKEMVPLEAAVSAWIDLANQKNGHDNIAIVLMQCQVGTAYPPTPQPLPAEEKAAEQPEGLDESELTEASRALLYGETTATDTAEPSLNRPVPPRPSRQLVFWVLRFSLALLVAAIVGAIAWWQLSRSSFNNPSDPVEPTEPTAPIEPLDPIEPDDTDDATDVPPPPPPAPDSGE
jgi:protein phosphatase